MHNWANLALTPCKLPIPFSHWKSQHWKIITIFNSDAAPDVVAISHGCNVHGCTPCSLTREELEFAIGKTVNIVTVELLKYRMGCMMAC